jgi:opacity protein-like surface antigen
MRKMKLSLILCIVFLLMSAHAFAAEATRDATIYELPSESAKQISAVHQGDPLKVSGKRMDNAEGAWVPVETPQGQGWVKSSALHFSEDEKAYAEKPAERHSTTSIFTSAGGGMLSSTSTIPTARLSAGVLFRVPQNEEWTVGTGLTVPLSQETAAYPYGRVQRFLLEGTLGHYFLDDRALLRGIFGFDFPYTNGAVDSVKFAVVAGLGAGYQFKLSDSIRAGLELTYEFVTSSAQQDYTVNNQTYTGVGFSSMNLLCLNLAFYFGL